MERPLYIHGALRPLCDLYAGFGGAGELRLATEVRNQELAGEILLAPPSAPRIAGHAALPIRCRLSHRVGCASASAPGSGT